MPEHLPLPTFGDRRTGVSAERAKAALLALVLLTVVALASGLGLCEGLESTAAPDAATPTLQPAALAPQAAPQQALVLNPDTAAALGLRNGLDLAIARTRIEEARTALLPIDAEEDVEASASLSYDVSGTFGDEPSSDGRSGSVSLSKSLFRTPRMKATRRAALASIDSAASAVPVTERELDLAVRLAVYDVLRQEQLVRAAVEQTRMRSEHLDLSRDMLQVGKVADFEVVQAETQVSAAIGDEVAARSALSQYLATLKQLLALPQETQLGVEPGLPPAEPPGSGLQRVEMACAQRPEIGQALAAIRQSETSVELAETTSDLTSGLSGSLSHSPFLDGSAKIRWKVGASASKVLLDQDAQVSAVESAAARLQAAQLELDMLRHDIALEVTQAELSLNDAWERLVVAEQGVREAQETLSIAQVRYEVRYGKGIEVLDAQASLTSMEVAAINAEYDVRTAIVQLRSAMGLKGDSEAGAAPEG